jgi:hypothetical protein
MVMLYSKTKPQEFAGEVREKRPLEGSLVITVEEWSVDTSTGQQASWGSRTGDWFISLTP